MKPKPVKTKKTTPVIRRFKPRKVLTPDLDHALANRSESVKIKLLEMESALPAEIKVETSNFLAILLQGRCQRERYDVINLCEGKFELRSSKVNGKQVRIQLICRRCHLVTEYSSNSNNNRIQLQDGEKSVNFLKDDVRAVLLALIAGSTYRTYETMNASNPEAMSQPTFYRIQKILCGGIVSCCKQVLAEYRET